MGSVLIWFEGLLSGVVRLEDKYGIGGCRFENENENEINK